MGVKLADLIEKMRANPKNVRFSDILWVCEQYFGKPRQTGSSHVIFRTPWEGDPRINIQNDHGKAKPYQVRQVLRAIELKEALSK